MSQVVAEVLRIPLDRIHVALLDKDVTPYETATSSSSSTVVMGLAVERAAQDLKRQLLKLAEKMLKTKVALLTLKNGKIYDKKNHSIAFEEIMAKHFGGRGGEIVGKGLYQDKKSKKAVLGSKTTFWEIGWGGAEVEVDRETGEVEVLKYISTADVGKAIHPVQCIGQDEGAVMFGLGHSLLEELVYSDGHLVNPI